MAINFNEDSVFSLTPIDIEDVQNEVKELLIGGESCLMAFHTVRDQVVFTNKRIISIDVQGITGARRSYSSMPYSRIQFFTIQTKGFLEMFADAELFIMFSNGFTAKFEFGGSVDMGIIGRAISEYALEK